MDRTTVLSRLRSKVEAGGFILGGGAGNGLSAKAQEAGGIDLLVIYNSGRYRMAGRGSLAGMLAYGNANDIVTEMALEVVSAVDHTPVLAGVNGTDPFLHTGMMLSTLRERGIAGIQNFPTVGLIDGVFRQNLEETGMGYCLEVDLIRAASQAGMLTTPYVFSEQDAVDMASAGADILVCHLGLTTGGSIGAETSKTLDDCVDLVDRWADAARSVNPDILVLCHGGPIATPEDAAYVIARARGIDGFYGASSMERLPVENAISAKVKDFTEQLRLARKPGLMTEQHLCRTGTRQSFQSQRETQR